MSRFVLIVSVFGLGLILWLMFSRPALIRGMADGMLVSPYRPGVAVRPASTFSLLDARRTTLSVPVEHQALPSRADAWYALYGTKDTVPSRMVVLFAQARPRYEWLYDAPRPAQAVILKQKQSQHSAMEGKFMLYALEANREPQQTGTDVSSREQGSLVCRWRFLLPLWRFVVVIEYSEPFSSGTLPPDADPAALAAFERRAYHAFTLIRAGKKDPLPAPSKHLPYPSQTGQSKQLSAMTGPVRTSTTN